VQNKSVTQFYIVYKIINVTEEKGNVFCRYLLKKIDKSNYTGIKCIKNDEEITRNVTENDEKCRNGDKCYQLFLDVLTF
jgi:hypothetical protein